jgi:hypothetical protein
MHRNSTWFTTLFQNITSKKTAGMHHIVEMSNIATRPCTVGVNVVQYSLPGSL